MATRLVDPNQLELDRMIQMSGGEVPQLETTMDGIIYVALQELATRVSHRNTKTRLDDEAAQLTDLDRRSALHVVGQGIAKVANDENLHYLFYKGLAQKAFEIEPLQFLLSLRRVLKHFKMPGTGIPQFATKKEQIADVGIFDATIYYEQVVCQVVLKQWKIDQRADLGQSEQNVRKDVMRRIGALQIASALDLKSREKTRSALFFG